jgi:sugar transferase (PEP-CTERM/EpsH1 system associated)
MTRALHVAHVVHSLQVGGLENGVVNLVNGAGPGLRHTVVCLTTAGPLRARLRPEVEVFVLGKGRGHDVRAFVRLARLLRRLRPDIVHSRNWATFDAVLAARLARVPAVVHGEHGRDVSDPEGLHARRNRIRRVCAPLVDRFVTVSDDLRGWLVTRVGIPAGKVTRIHNGVDTARFAPADGLAERAGLGWAGNAEVIGTVGRLDPVKDQAGLVEAFARVAPAHPRAVLAIVGDGPCRAELERVVAAHGVGARVRLLAERSDVPEILRTMDVFVLPSIAEGISNTLLEAMATGLPLVATRVGGNPELVQDGVNGRLVPRRDRTALAGALAAYLDDPHLRAIHGKSSRQRALDVFALPRMLDAYADLYGGLGPAAGRSA